LSYKSSPQRLRHRTMCMCEILSPRVWDHIHLACRILYTSCVGSVQGWLVSRVSSSGFSEIFVL
jgi:hypothetical protein